MPTAAAAAAPRACASFVGLVGGQWGVGHLCRSKLLVEGPRLVEGAEQGGACRSAGSFFVLEEAPMHAWPWQVSQRVS